MAHRTPSWKTASVLISALALAACGGGGTAEPAPAPQLALVTPNAGSTAGGTTVVLTGSNFAAGIAVRFGGASATVSPGSVTATSVTVTTPPGAAGPADVTVVNPDGQSATDSAGFLYQVPPPPPPVISDLTPTSGSTAGGTAVTIQGTGFAAGATVRFGTAEVTPTAATATTIQVTTPARAAGAVDVTVRNPDGLTSAPVTYTYLAPVGPTPPTISALSISTGTTNGGELCVVTGSGFVAGSVVTFGGATASLAPGPGPNPTSTSIAVTVPAHAPGTVDVTVSNPGGDAATLQGAYTYVGPAPVVSFLNRRGGPTAGGTQVLALGTGFVPGVTVTVGGAPATNVSLVSAGVGSTAVSFFTPPQPEGLYDVVVTNPDGQSDVAPVQFHYGPAPVITGLTCSGGCASVRPDDLITLAGDHFSTGPGQAVSVTFRSTDTGQQAAAAIEATPAPSPTQLVVRAPKLDGGLCGSPPGPCRYSIEVTNFDGQSAVSPVQVIYQ